MNNLVVNTRCLGTTLTGSQRYVSSILKYVPYLKRIAPSRPLHGWKGHVWEQLVLPRRIKDDEFLWSPSHTGPIKMKRQVVTIHDLVPFDHPEWLKPSFVRAYRTIVPRVARQARHIITISEFTRERIEDILEISPEKITVVPNGVDVPRARATCQKSHPLFILALGSIEPRKNLARLLQAWATVAEDLSEYELWIAGGPGTSRVYQQVRLLLGPRVRVFGHVPEDELHHMLSCASLLAYPSLYEGFGLPPLEAMARGTPVLTSNVTALPEVVGSCAVLVDPQSTASIAAGLLQVLDTRSMRRLGRMGLERACRLTWRQSAERTIEVLTSAAGETDLTT